MTDDGGLTGAAVQRVDVGTVVVVLHARLPGETWFLIVARGAAGGVGALREKPWRGASLPGGAASADERARLRNRLEGAQVVHIDATGIWVASGPILHRVEALGLSPLSEVDPGEQAFGPSLSRERLMATGERLATELVDLAIASRRREVARMIGRASMRVARRIEAVRGDLARIEEASVASDRGALFVAAAARAKAGATRLAATDWSSGEPVEVELTLDPARGAREQVEALFKRARRLKQGREIVSARLAEADAALARFAALGPRVTEAATLDELESIAEAASAAAPKDLARAAGSAARDPAARPGSAPRKKPYRTFVDATGARIFVGRSGAQNDELATRVARPHDLWLHARGRTGAHVVVPLEKNKTCPPELLIDAAHLAAHFSSARGDDLVEIEHTPRRYVRKPRGSAPGLVLVQREKVVALRVEQSRIQRLLASEET